MIDLDSLVALQAVDTHGSVVAAAAALGYTPSAVSQQVKRLERQTGVALLERVGRGVLLTGAGRHLVDEGAQLLTDLEQLEAGLHQQAGTVTGRLHLTAFSTATRGLVAPAIRDLALAHPDLVLALTERDPWDAVDDVAAGRTDVAVVHSWGDVALSIPAHLVATPLLTDVADVVVPSTHALAGRERVTPHDLRDESWIATPAGTICRQWLDRMHDGTGGLPRIVHEATEFDSHLALASAGLGIALVPRLGRRPLGGTLVAVPVQDPEPTRAVVVLHRRSLTASPAMAAVVRALIAAAAATGSSTRWDGSAEAVDTGSTAA